MFVFFFTLFTNQDVSWCFVLIHNLGFEIKKPPFCQKGLLFLPNLEYELKKIMNSLNCKKIRHLLGTGYIEFIFKEKSFFKKE